MGQQLPYLPNGQSPFGQQFPTAAQSLPIQLPALPGVPNAAGGMGPTLPGQIPGIDPRMLQQAQQSLANPNGGDVMGNLLPGPKELGMGAAIGVGTAYGFQLLQDHHVFDNTAKFIDKYTGGKWLADKIDPKLQDASKYHPIIREFTTADAVVRPSDIEKLSPEAAQTHINAVAQKAVDNMERRQLEGTIEKFQKRVSGDKKKKAELREAYDKMLAEMRDSGHMPGHGGHNFMEGKLPDTMRISGNPAYQAELTQFNTSMENALKTAKKAAQEAGKGSIPIKVKNDPYRTYYNFINQTTHEDLKAKAIEEWQKIGSESKELKDAKDFIHHQGAVDELNRQFRYLNGKEKLSKEEEKLRKELFHLKERLSGIKNLYTPLYESQAKLTAELSAQGVGPVGRTVRSFANYLQRIFRGDTMKMGGAKAGEAGQGFMAKMGSHLGPMFGPVMMGAFLFGFSFQSAKNAKEGEKKQAFFHNLLGQQIFNFIGWEFGRKVLNSVEFGSKIFRGWAGKTLPAFFGHRIPFLGAITLGGFGTEIAAMLVFGGLFQKVGEKISHAIFGKPSQASIDGKGNTPAAQAAPGQPGQPNQAPVQGQNQGQTQASNPALSGMFNPTLMNQAMQQSGLQPSLGASYGSVPGAAFPGMNPGAAMARPSVPPSLPATPPMGNPVGNPGSYGNPAMARTPQAPQPAAPISSLSPMQISQSKVANDYNIYYNKLKSDKTLDKRPGELLDKM